MKKLKLLMFFLSCFIFVFTIKAQEGPVEVENLREEALNVFMDSYYINMDFIRKEIPYINYVRDRKESDVHIMITRRGTGSGGYEYTISYFGTGDFVGINDTLIYNSGPDETTDETRIGRSRILQMGLMKYVARTPINRKIKFNYSDKGKEDMQLVEDKWKSWVFKVDVSGEFRYEESYNNQEAKSSFSASKVTPEWRIDFNGKGEYNVSNYTMSDGDNYRNERTSYEVKGLIVKSLGDHWSVGAFAEVDHSTYSNNQIAYSLYPAVEYNLFPYHESTMRQLRFNYSSGYRYINYLDTTLYDKMNEGLFQQRLTIAYEIRQPWGSITTSLRGNAYWHDFSKNNLSFNTWISWRIYKGLSFRISGTASLIRDQLSLNKSGATEEEILLRKKQIASNYKYSGNIGLSYTFGSIYNNVVNPRFGQSSGYRRR